MHEVLVNRLGGLSLPRKSVVRLTDRPDMTLDVYRGRKTTMQQQQQPHLNRLHETIQMRGHNIWFQREIRKIIIKYSLLSRALEIFYYKHCFFSCFFSWYPTHKHSTENVCVICTCDSYKVSVFLSSVTFYLLQNNKVIYF